MIPDSDDQDDEMGRESRVDRLRRKLGVLNGGGAYRARTVPAIRLSHDECVLAETVDYPDDIDRPRTREDCLRMARPCPFVSCSHHLYLDVNPTTGAMKLNAPHLEVWEMPETCSLDIADRGGATLDEVGRVYNLTRERVRQIQARGLEKLAASDEFGLPLDRT